MHSLCASRSRSVTSHFYQFEQNIKSIIRLPIVSVHHRFYFADPASFQTVTSTSKALNLAYGNATEPFLYQHPGITIQQTENKGLGFFALQPIAKSTLILVEAPTFVHSTWEELISSMLSLSSNEVFLRQIGALLHLDYRSQRKMTDEDRSELMGLMADSNLVPLPSLDALYDASTSFLNNNYATPRNQSAVYHKGSRFNHSCLSNCSWTVINHIKVPDPDPIFGSSSSSSSSSTSSSSSINNCLAVTTTRDVSAGDELVLWYTGFDPQSFEEFQSRDFVCECPICTNKAPIPAHLAKLGASPIELREKLGNLVNQRREIFKTVINNLLPAANRPGADSNAEDRYQDAVQQVLDISLLIEQIYKWMGGLGHHNSIIECVAKTMLLASLRSAIRGLNARSEAHQVGKEGPMDPKKALATAQRERLLAELAIDLAPWKFFKENTPFQLKEYFEYMSPGGPLPGGYLLLEVDRRKKSTKGSLE